MVFKSKTISDSAILEAAERAGTLLDMPFIAAVRKRIADGEDLKAFDVGIMAEKAGIRLSDDFRREFLAEIIRPSSLMVIPVFNEAVIVHRSVLPSHCKWQVVVDWGGVRDKTVALLMTYEFNNDLDIYVDEKVFDPNTSTDKIVKSLRDWDGVLGNGPKWADVPGQLQVDLNDKWDYIVNVPQKTNWLASVNTMASRFSTNNVRIFPECKFLIASVRAGMFNKTRTDFDRTEALGHMDALAAAMYGIRCQDRENPYSAGNHAPDIRTFVNPEIVRESNSENLSGLTGKTFGPGPKKFGRFAR